MLLVKSLVTVMNNDSCYLSCFIFLLFLFRAALLIERENGQEGQEGTSPTSLDPVTYKHRDSLSSMGSAEIQMLKISEKVCTLQSAG